MKFRKKVLCIAMLLITAILCTVPVYAKTKYFISEKSIYLYKNDTHSLYLYDKKKPEKHIYKQVKWKSSKPSVVSVSKKGKLKAKKPGSATITAVYKNKKYKTKVRVYNNSNIVLNYFDINKTSSYKKGDAVFPDTKGKKIAANIKAAYLDRDGNVIIELAVMNQQKRKNYVIKKVHILLYDEYDFEMANEWWDYPIGGKLRGSSATILGLKIPERDLLCYVDLSDLESCSFELYTFS